MNASRIERVRRMWRMIAGVVIFVGCLGIAQAQAVQTEVGIEASALLGEAAVENTFGAASFMSTTPYLDADLNVSVYALEYKRYDTGTTVTVIASARRDDCPVIMMWQGVPKHKDPRALAAARRTIKDRFGLDATKPSRLFWLDAFELWAEFPEKNPKTGRPICCNLYTTEIGDHPVLAVKWQNRLANTDFMYASQAMKADLAAAGLTSDPFVRSAQAAAGRADHVDALWHDAETWLAHEGSGNLFASKALPLADAQTPNRALAVETKITVTYPNSSGIKLQKMKDYRIRWTVSGSVGSTVRIQLYKGSSAVKTIASNVSATAGSYTWWVPKDVSLASDYKIKISSTNDSSINDRSDNAFTITAYSAPPSHSEHYISGVPNINQEDVPDCGVVSSMDVILYWDRHGYHRLVNGSDLQTLRTTLRQAMHYAGSGTYSQNESDGIREYCNDSEYQRQYAFQVSDPQYVLPLISDPFPTLTQEIIYSHPVRIVVRDYTNDPNNPTDKGYVGADGTGGHAMCVVGYVQNTLFAGHTGNRWVIVHDNHNLGGHFPDADLIDDEPYLDWDRATNCIITIKPGPSSNPVVTYPSPSSLSGPISWKPGQIQSITWRNFNGSSVKIELYKGSTRSRTISYSTPNDGEFSFTIPSDEAGGSDYRVKITSLTDSASDSSDANFSIVPAMMPLTVNGTALTASISPAGTANWYKFTVPSSGMYTIETWPGTLTDNYMYLYGPNDQSKLIDEDDDDGTGAAALIGPRMLAPGTYYVKVVGYYSSSSGTYQIQVRGVTPVSLTVNASPATGNIAAAGDVNWFKFTVPVSGVYTIESWTGTLTDNYMYLYGPNSMSTWVSEDNDKGTGQAALIGPKVLAAGTYYVKMKSYVQAGTGNYTIQVRRTNPTTLTINASAISGNISPSGDSDWYQFTVPSTGMYVIETWAGTLVDNYMYLYGPNSYTTEIERDDDDGVDRAALIGPRVMAPGTYYARVCAYYTSQTGTYSIRVRTITPSQLTLNASPSTGGVSSTTDADWYKITIASAGVYVFETWAGSLTDNYMYLYGPNDVSPLIESDDDDGTGYAALVGPLVLAPGTYYLKIVAAGSAKSGTYTIQARNVSTVTLTPNTAATAGNISTSSDTDWYKFTVPTSGSYTIETWSGTLSDNYMRLYSPTGLVESDDDDGNAYAALIARTLTAGTYFVKITAQSGTGTYSIQVRD